MLDWQEIYRLIGPAGAALIVLAAAALYITLFNLFYLAHTGHVFRREMRTLDESSLERLKGEAGANPLVAVVRDIVFTHGGHSDDIRAEVAYLLHKNLRRVANSLYWLKLIAAVSPLCGLLGTVLGMVEVFRTIADNASPDPTMLAGGIWQALVTTVMGLAIAIPVLAAYYFFVLQMKGFRIGAIEYSYRALGLRRRRGAAVGALDEEEPTA